MGYIHIYTGDGKGKTTAAMGLAIRAAGCGKRVFVIQFLKGGKSGELESLRRLSIPVWRNSREYDFFPALGEEEKAELLQEHNDMLRRAYQAAQEGAYDLIVLDELICAYELGAVDRSLVIEFLEGDYPTECVLTGRDAPQNLIEKADYVTVMQKRKHPFDRGIMAREGIEY